MAMCHMQVPLKAEFFNETHRHEKSLEQHGARTDLPLSFGHMGAAETRCGRNVLSLFKSIQQY